MAKRNQPPAAKVPDALWRRIEDARYRLFGENKIIIPWDVVDDMLSAGLSGFEIAGILGVHEDTLYNACRVDHDQEFRQYKARKKARGDGMLRMAQFQKAINGSETMQVWLGKQRLGQRERPEEKKGEGLGAGGFAILEIGDNGRSVKDQNPLNKPEEEVNQEEAVDTSEFE